VKRLKQEHFQSFWYFSSSISFAIIGIFAGILIATSLDEDERKAYMDLLAEYRWILRISSTGTSVTTYGVTVLDANNQFLEQQTENPPLQQETPTFFSPGGTSGISPASEEWMEKPIFNMQELDYVNNMHDMNAFTGDAFFTF
jgi:hypothetical protein